jgi:hypothetical protein
MLRLLYIGAGLLVAVPALAQNPQPTNPSSPTHPVGPPNAASPPPEKIAPPVVPSAPLARHNGIITPPKVDPGMRVRPPVTGQRTMPVIPPPGTKGGNPAVIPK